MFLKRKTRELNEKRLLVFNWYSFKRKSPVQVQRLVTFSGGFYSNPTTQAYLTFDLKSTGDATTIPPSLGGIQSFIGSFKITSNADGSGTVYVASASNALTGTLVATNGLITFPLSTTASSDLTGTLISDGFIGPFGVALQFSNVTPGFGLTTIGGHQTIRSFTSVVNGTVTGTAVPEPSTLSLLGLGAAGLVFSTYRRRKAVNAI